MHKIKHLKKLHHVHKKNIWTIVLAVFFIFCGIVMLWLSTLQIPDMKSFENRKVAESTKIYDRTGKIVLYDVHQDIKRTNIPLSSVSRNIQNATLAIEDNEFYQHHGIQIKSFLRAVFANIGAGGYSQGGSTITQQVIKNTVLTKDKTITRKLKEMVLAVKLENVLTKEQILELYFNESSYGGSVYGVEEASKMYFGKSASETTLAESAYLAAIPNAPTYYSPYGNHKDALESRKNLVLSEMLRNKFITQDEYEKALTEKVEFQPQDSKGIKAPHFVIFVKEKLVEKYGEQEVEGGGLKVITTLDWNLEQKAEELTKQYATTNKDKYNAENASVVAIDSKNGQILAMVGSRDYFDTEIDGNFNVALAHRQPGSSFKPIVYATAFMNGYTPDTVLFDLPTEFDTNCTPEGKPISPIDIIPADSSTSTLKSPCYMPENYDGVYRGPITLKNALAQSINIPAIKTLYLAGINNSLNTAKNLGIKSLGDANQYGLTLVLGGGEVSLLDMTSAYSTFANNGIRNPYSYILEVQDKNGNILEQYKDNPIRVLPEQTALQITDILSDEDAREPAFGYHSYLYIPNRQVAVKTGTTNDYKDAWIIGYSPQITIGAWAGNNNNTPMEKKVAGFIIAPLWNSVMNEALKNYPLETFKKPVGIYDTDLKPVLRGIWQGGVSYFIDKFSGKLATEYTPDETKQEKVVKNVHSILYWLNKDDPNGSAPVSPNDDAQFERWEYAVKKWVGENSIQEENISIIPKEFDDLHKPEYAPKINISSPLSNMTYDEKKLSINFSYSGRFPLSKTDYFWNGDFIGTTGGYSYSFSFSPASFDSTNTTEQNELKVVVYDSVYNKTEVKIGVYTQ